MAVLPIRITGDPVLHNAANAVTEFDETLAELVADMFDTMKEAPGVGLAAPQIGEPLQLFVYDWVDDAGERWRGTAVNPQLWISPASVEPLNPDEESEGCLSLPGERYPLRRADAAILRALDQHGKPYELTAHGWLARIFQHEYDHLQGILYADRLDPASAKSLAKVIRQENWGTPGLSWLPGIDDLEP